MRFQLTSFLLAATAAIAIAGPTLDGRDKGNGGGGGGGGGDDGGDDKDHTSSRPHITCHPKHPHTPPPSPPPRGKVCYIKSHNDGVTDDSTFILDALQYSSFPIKYVNFRRGGEGFQEDARLVLHFFHPETFPKPSSSRNPI